MPNPSNSQGKQCCVPSRLFASGGLQGPQDDSKNAKGDPRRAQAAPGARAQGRSQGAPRGPQQAPSEFPEGRRKLRTSFS
eukprot:2151931-Pyramimonas_sp.AAC.1